MYLDTNECFKNTGKINSTRFGDFYVMASKGDIQEKKHYLDELQYIVNRCRDILNNNGSIEIFKEYTNAPEETVKIIDNINDFADRDFTSSYNIISNYENPRVHLKVRYSGILFLVNDSR